MPLHRPLTGCRLLHQFKDFPDVVEAVSVPLRGMDCYSRSYRRIHRMARFRPLMGYGLLLKWMLSIAFSATTFPSPYGVWIATV